MMKNDQVERVRQKTIATRYEQFANDAMRTHKRLEENELTNSTLEKKSWIDTDISG